jgi:hypothetical protein
VEDMHCSRSSWTCENETFVENLCREVESLLSETKISCVF